MSESDGSGSREASSEEGDYANEEFLAMSSSLVGGTEIAAPTDAELGTNEEVMNAPDEPLNDTSYAQDTFVAMSTENSTLMAMEDEPSAVLGDMEAHDDHYPEMNDQFAGISMDASIIAADDADGGTAPAPALVPADENDEADADGDEDCGSTSAIFDGIDDHHDVLLHQEQAVVHEDLLSHGDDDDESLVLPQLEEEDKPEDKPIDKPIEADGRIKKSRSNNDDEEIDDRPPTSDHRAVHQRPSSHSLKSASVQQAAAPSNKRDASEVAIVAPTAAELTARTIASSSSWLQLYGDVQQHLASAYTGSQQTVKIPDTIIFHRMKAIQWYHTGPAGHGVEEGKKALGADGNIEVDKVFRYFCEASKGKSIVASMLWYGEPATAPHAFGNLKISHLTEEDLRNLLMYNNAKDAIVPAYWILQGFVGGGKSGHVATIVSENLGSLKNFELMQWKNKHLLRVHPKVQESCLTVESADSTHVKSSSVKNEQTSAAVADVSNIALRCMTLGGLPTKSVVGLKFFFQVDKHDTLWLLWCDVPSIKEPSRSIFKDYSPEAMTGGGPASPPLMPGSVEAIQEEKCRLAVAADALRKQIHEQTKKEQVRLADEKASQQLPVNLDEWESAWQAVNEGKAPVLAAPLHDQLKAHPPTESTKGSLPLMKGEAPEANFRGGKRQSRRKPLSEEQRQADRQAKVQARKARLMFNSERIQMLKLPKKSSIKPLPSAVRMAQRLADQRGPFAGYNYVGSADSNSNSKPQTHLSAASSWVEPAAVKIAAEHAQLRLRLLMKVDEVADSHSHSHSHSQQPRPPRPPSGRPVSSTSSRVAKGRLVKGAGTGPDTGAGAGAGAGAGVGAPQKFATANAASGTREGGGGGGGGGGGEAEDDETTQKKIHRSQPPKPDELSMNKKAKSASMLSAVPLPPPMRLPPPRPIFGPKAEGRDLVAAMFCKRVNAFAKQDRAKAVEASKKLRPPPPGHADDLMDIVGDLVSRTSDRMILLLSRSSTAARVHKHLLMEEERLQMAQTNAASATGRMALPRLLDMDEDDEEDGGSKKMVADIVSAVNKSHAAASVGGGSSGRSSHANIGEGEGEGGGGGGGGGPSERVSEGATNRNHTLHMPRTTDFVYKRKDKHDDTDGHAPSIKQSPRIHGGNTTHTHTHAHVHAHAHTHVDAQKPEADEDTSSEVSFLQLVKLMSCVPNHRPVEELCTVLLWLLASGGSDDSGGGDGSPPIDVDRATSLTDAFAQFVRHTTACSRHITKVAVDRGPTSEKEAKLKWRCAMSLRSWYVERQRRRLLDAATIQVEQRGLHNSFARSKSGRFSFGEKLKKTDEASDESKAGDKVGERVGDQSPWVDILHRPIKRGRHVTAAGVKLPAPPTDGTPGKGGLDGRSVASVADSATSAGSRHTPRAPSLVLKLGRPVSAGVIRRLGNHSSFARAGLSHDGEDTGRPESEGGAGTGRGGAEEPDQLRVFTTRVHIGLDTFVAATGMGGEEDDVEVDDDEEGKGRRGRRRYTVPTAAAGQAMGTGPTLHWQSGIVARAPHEVENAYQEISKSLIPLASSQGNAFAPSPNGDDDGDDEGGGNDYEMNSTAGEMSGGDTPESRRGSSPASPAKSVTSFSEVSRVTDTSGGASGSASAGGRSVGTHPHHSFQSPSAPRLRPGVHSVQQQTMDQNERMFHKLAPPLNARQRFLVVAALLSDVARSIVLGVSVLVKHAGAGHVITYRDLEIVLGAPCVAIVGRPALAKLLAWLQANIRSDINFKVASQTYTDTGLQRLFAFWPQLVVEVVSTPEEEEDGPDSPLYPPSAEASMVPALCNVRLMWLDRHWTSRLFREPDEFTPSINQV